MRRIRNVVLVSCALLLVPLGLPARASMVPSPAIVAARAATTLGGRACPLIAAPAAAPIGLGACPGVRPGGQVETPSGSCTYNFLFLGSDGNRYMGTAGHCILGADGEQVWGPGGPPATTGGTVVGEFAYAVRDDVRDFALVRLHPSVPASPEMCHFGGPTGIAGDAAGPVVLHHYGNGLGVGLVPARSGVALSMTDPDTVVAVLAVAFGDSGSGVIDSSGGAVGVLVGLGVAVAGSVPPAAGTALITRIGPQAERARVHLGLASLALQTAPLA